jgi:hypothetical protein
LFILQAVVFAAIRAPLPVVAAYHPLLAMVVFSVAVRVAVGALSLERETSRGSASAQPAAPF